MVIHLNKFYEENEMIIGEQEWPSNFLRDFATKIILNLNYHFHHLMPADKRDIMDNFGNGNALKR